MNTNQAPSSATISPSPSLIGIKELLRRSIYLFKNNVRLFFGVAGILIPVRIGAGVALYIVANIVYHRIEAGFLSLFEVLIIFLGLFLTLVCLVVYTWFRGSLTIAVREIGSEKAITIKEVLKDGWRIKWSFLLVTILFGLAVIGGAALLIIPGIIFFIWYLFYPYVLVCENLRGRAVLSRSRELVRGYWWGVTIRVLLLFAMVGGIGFIISFIPFIPSIPFSERVMKTLFYQFIALPFSTIYFFILYENLKIVKEPSSL